MQNQYYNEMIQLLMGNPEGMRVGTIARAIYNASCDLFDAQAGSRFHQIYTSIRRYLWQQSRRQRSPFRRIKWGTYALRHNFVYQLELTFDEWEDDGPIPKPETRKTPANEPYMLNLFGWT
jgi:hypothetical protein